MTKWIGIFDSGIGGLTVARRIVEKQPERNLVFFGDLANMPYGDKTKEEIQALSVHDAQMLEKFDLSAVVIACNTADSAALKHVRKHCKVPVYGVIEPTASFACEVTKNGKIGVIATRATIRSRAYSKAIKKIRSDFTVYSRACPELVPLIEAGHLETDDPEIVQALKKYIPGLLKKGIDTLVLGCTHYPLISETIHNLYPDLLLVSSSDVQAEQVLQQLSEEPEEMQGQHRYYVSADAEFFTTKAGIFLGKPLDPPAEILK